MARQRRMQRETQRLQTHQKIVEAEERAEYVPVEYKLTLEECAQMLDDDIAADLQAALPDGV